MIGSIEPRVDGRRAMLALAGAITRTNRADYFGSNKILVVRPDHLGDILFLTPALRDLRKGFPSAEIVGLVGPWARPVLARNRNLDRILTWDFPWYDRKPRTSLIGPYRSLVALAARLRVEQFDLAIQFRGDFWWGALACRLAGIPAQIGYDSPATRPFLTRIIPNQHGGHIVDDNLDLVRALTGTSEKEPLEFPLTETDRRRASVLLDQTPETARWVALQAGAGAPVKVWPLDRLARVGRALRDEFGTSVVVVGGPNEVDSVRQVCDGVGVGAIGLAGVTTLVELGAVLERCALVVGPDSGPLHLAVAVRTPTVHLFGPADARRFGPYGDPSWHRVICSPRACVPCNRLDFVGPDVVTHNCVADITAEEVLKVARPLLARSLLRVS